MVRGQVFSGSHAVHPITFEMRADIADVDCVTSRKGLMGLSIGLVNVIYGARMAKMLQFASVAWGQGSGKSSAMGAGSIVQQGSLFVGVMGS